MNIISQYVYWTYYFDIHQLDQKQLETTKSVKTDSVGL